MDAATDARLEHALAEFVAGCGCSDVKVSVVEGAVTLVGPVASETARTALIDLVHAHDGVVAVRDQLSVAETARAVAQPRP